MNLFDPYILFGLAIIAILIFAFMWGRFSNNEVNDQYTPPIPYEYIPQRSQDHLDYTQRSQDHLDYTQRNRPKRGVNRVIGDITPLYSKKRRSRGENMCARSLEEIFGVPFPSERPSWALGLKGRPLEYDCINHDLKLIVEYEGEQHYEIGHFGMDQEKFNLQNEYDRMKFKYATDRGYYIIQVPYTVPLEEIKDFIIDYFPANRKRRLDRNDTL